MKYSISILAVLLLVACGPGEGDRENQARPASKAAAGPDGSVPAEEGGPGFDRLADAQGWQTRAAYFRMTSPGVKKGGGFTYGLSEFPTTLRPEGKDSATAVNFMLNSMMYERLLGLDIDFDYVPALASHWKIEEDQQTFWFRINPRAMWADGYPVTTEDVLYTWRLLVDKGILAPYTNMLYERYEEPEVISKYLVKVKAKYKDWRNFLYFGGFMDIYPAHVLKNITGKEFLKQYHFNVLPGTGPYTMTVKDIKKGKSLTLHRRKDYWDRESNPYTANFDTIKIRIVRDERLHLEKFKKGELDFYRINRAQWWKEEFDFAEAKQGLVQKRKVFTFIPQGISGFAFNMREWPFDNKKVRLAFACLFNRSKLIEKLFYNEYQHLDSYYPNTRYANPDNPKVRFDPNKGIALLEEAGFNQKDAQGYRIDEQGRRLAFTLSIHQSSNRYMTVIQEDLKKAGIKMDIKFATYSTLWQLAMDRKFKIKYQSWVAASIPNPDNVWLSSLADNKDNNNICGLKNARVDELIQEYALAFDPERRVEVIREIDGILSQEMPYALGWFGPFERMAYWNKFGHPKSYLSRRGDWRDVSLYWWHEPEKAKRVQAGRKDNALTMPVGGTDVTFWQTFDKRRQEQPDKPLAEIWREMP